MIELAGADTDSDVFDSVVEVLFALPDSVATRVDRVMAATTGLRSPSITASTGARTRPAKGPRILTTTVGSYPVPDWLAALPSEQAVMVALRERPPLLTVTVTQAQSSLPAVTRSLDPQGAATYLLQRERQATGAAKDLVRGDLALSDVVVGTPGRLLDLARRALQIAAGGLARRARVNENGSDETIFLGPLMELVEAGITPAERKLELFHGAWGGNVDPVFREFAY